MTIEVLVLRKICEIKMNDSVDLLPGLERVILFSSIEIFRSLLMFI